MARSRLFSTDCDPPDDPRSATDQPMSVGELTRRIKQTLESRFDRLIVVGELFDVSRARTGHVFLTLKDPADGSQLSAVIWRSAVPSIRFDLQEGLEVVVRGSLDLYAPQGSYKLIVRRIDPVGEGALQLAFRQLHARLAAEGLFDPDRKRTLPRLPRWVAIVTSPEGAALRDFLRIATRRFSGVRLTVIPAKMQGVGSAQEVTAALDQIGRLHPAPDVVVVTRGGGSAEDLWAFNEEITVRAIAATPIPVVSAVGHETDITLADLVADMRAATPSEAAELVLPSQDDLIETLSVYARRLARATRSVVETARRETERIAIERVFRHPADTLLASPRLTVEGLADRLVESMAERKRTASEEIGRLADRLAAISPVATLARGYSVTSRANRPDHPLTEASDIVPGEEILSRIATGRIRSRVTEVRFDPPHRP